MVNLELSKNSRRLHIGSFFVDLNESDYQELVKIFSRPLLPENKGVKSAEEILDEEISDSLKNILEQSDTPEDLRSFRRYILNAMERYKSQPALPTKEKEGFPINDAVNSMMGNNAPTNKQE